MKEKKLKFTLYRVDDGKCENHAVASLFEKYTSETATPEEAEEYEEHLLECITCAVLVKNFRTTRAASAYYGIPPGPELDQHMGKLYLSQPPRKFMQATKKLFLDLKKERKKKKLVN